MTKDEEDLRVRAGQVLAEAATLPGPGEVRDLAVKAVRHGGTPDMSMEEIRALAADAVECAEQVTELLRRLSGLLGDGTGGEP